MSDDRPGLPSGQRLLLGVMIALVVVLCVSRLGGLGAKLPHHDEMVHLSLSETLAVDGRYRASPAYHGPLLYHLEAGVVRVAGSGLWQARLVPALAGLAAALALVGLAWRESGMAVALAVAVLVTLSPSWAYYSRFNAHDTLILLMTVLVAWGRWHWMHGAVRGAAWLIAVALALAWSTKLNALFLLGAIVLWPAVWRVAAPEEARRRSLAWPRPATVLGALGAAAAIVGVLFVTTYVAILEDARVATAVTATLRAALTEPVAYWSSLHSQERLRGPFHYYVAMLALYEPLLVAGVGLALVGAWRRTTRPWALAAVAVAMGAVLCAASWPVAPWVRDVLHLHPLHVLVLPMVAAALWTLARARGRAGDDAGVWWTWMAATQTALYSYAGEKVPWLTVHVALPWFMVAAPAVVSWWTTGRRLARALVIGLALLTGYGAMAVTTWSRSDVAEPLVQLEYTPDTHAALAHIADTCRWATTRDVPCLVTTADAQWPARWYLRDAGDAAVEVGANAAHVSTPFAFLPVRGASDAEATTDLTTSHEPRAVRFAAWGTWVEWLHRPNPVELVRFWTQRRSLGPRRGVPYELWVRRDLMGAWDAPRTHTPARPRQTP